MHSCKASRIMSMSSRACRSSSHLLRHFVVRQSSSAGYLPATRVFSVLELKDYLLRVASGVVIFRVQASQPAFWRGCWMISPANRCIQTLHQSGQSLRRQASSCFNGVSWHKAARKFVVRVYFEGKNYHAGLFRSEICAAHAYDQRLRAICHDGLRLKRSLNFPSSAEASFSENTAIARARGVAAQRDRKRKEEESFCHLQQRLLCSTVADFEVVRVPGFSRADALFQRKGSSAGGLPLQLKAASASGLGDRPIFCFKNTAGYDGMLLILVAIDHGIVWAVPGAGISQVSYNIQLGSGRDELFRVTDVGHALVECFKHTAAFPHITLTQAGLRCEARTHRLEMNTHLQLAAFLASAGYLLKKNFEVASAIDSMLSGGGKSWRIQEKASHPRSRCSAYQINMWKHAGVLGKVAYSASDFDLLLAAVLQDGKLAGLFLLPSTVLCKHGLIGCKPTALRLVPPWAPCARHATTTKYAWQVEYYVDLHGASVPAMPPVDVRSRLEQVLQAV